MPCHGKRKVEDIRQIDNNVESIEVRKSQITNERTHQNILPNLWSARGGFLPVINRK